MHFRAQILLLALSCLLTTPVLAAPLAQPGDIGLRHDIQVLADSGAITGPATDYGLMMPMQYDAVLVVASYLITVAASFVALMVPSYLRSERRGRKKQYWLLLGAISVGICVWSMHFVAMLATHLPVAVSYDGLFTAVSVVPAIIAGGIFLAALGRDSIRTGWLSAAGATMGLGIGAMHYIGMAAMQVNANMAYEPRILALAIGLAALFAIVIPHLMVWSRAHRLAGSRGMLVVSSAVVGLAVTAVHYAGMWAVRFYPLESAGAASSGMNTVKLATMVVMAIAVLAGLTVAAVVMDRQFATGKAKRMQVAQLARYLHQAPDAVLIISRAGKILFVNALAIRMFGYAKKETIGQPVGMLVPEEDRLAHGNHVSGYFQNPTARVMGAGSEFSALRKDGTGFPVEISLSPIDIDGEQYAAAAVRDISRRKAIEEQLRQAQKMQAVGELTGGIAHDFNNLLAVIIGNLELLELPSTPHQAIPKYTQAALDAALRGADLTRRLLAFSRRQVLVPKVIDINELVTEIEPLIHRTLGEDVSIKTKLDGDLWLTRVDPGQLENALINLAINARDAMPDGGTLTIETGNTVLDADYAENHAEVSPGDFVMLRVSDNGTGIPKDILSRVFEPFFSTKETGKGTGLGLSMVYGFVKQSVGHITIYSEAGHGATITIYLARSLSAIEKTGITSTVLRQIPSGNETILLVEDDAEVRKIGCTILTGLGYRVLEADTGPEALALLEQHDDIDLLFTDMVMPGGMTGAELAGHARNRRPKLRVLYTSGYTDTVVFENGVLPNGDDILNKPYQKRELAQKVRDALDQG